MMNSEKSENPAVDPGIDVAGDDAATRVLIKGLPPGTFTDETIAAEVEYARCTC